MSRGWVDAFVAFSGEHEAEFDAACESALAPGDAIVTLSDRVRVRVRDPRDDGLFLLALPGDLAQRHRVGAGRYEFPAESWPVVREAASGLAIRSTVVRWVVCRLELRHRRLLDALRAALLRRAPVFGPTYPRIVAV